MRCSNCGQDFRPTGEIFITANEQIELPGVGGARTKLVPRVLCPACLARRRRTEWLFAALLGGAILVAIAAGIVSQVLSARG